MGVLVSLVDHIAKPRLIAGRSALHPLAALIGVIGGLHMFGIVGFVLGPVLLGLLQAMLRFYREMDHYREMSV
jgi:predicted PurR-regulated permease PerM